MGSRKWVKLWCERWLNGSAHHESLVYQGILAGLMAIAGDGKYGSEGLIKLADGVGIPDPTLAKLLVPDNSPDAKKRDRIWAEVKPKLLQNKEISVTSDGVITMLKWDFFQSEYERTKACPSRQSTSKSTPESTPKSTAPELEERSKEDKKIPPIVPQKGDTVFFEQFWKAYPKKRSKGDARKAFKKARVDEQLLEQMLTALERAKKSPEWLKECGKYIPYPASWLNAEGWNDEYQEGGPNGDGKARGPTGTPGNRPAGAFDDLKDML